MNQRKMNFFKKKSFLWFLILIITIIWGFAWVYMKLVLQYMGPFTFSSFRFGIGSIVLLFLTAILKQGLPKRNQWKPLIIIGILQTTIVFTFVMYALLFVEAGKSSVLLYSMPIWSSLLAAKFLGEKITLSKYVGLIIGLIGLLTIVGWDLWTAHNWYAIIGEILITLAAISWAGANVYYRVRLEEIPQIQMSAFQMAFGTVGIFIVALITEWEEPIIINAESVYYILFTGIFASAVAFTLWFFVLKLIDMVTATLSTMLVPVFGLILSYFIIGEKMTNSIIIGSTCIISGIIIAQVSNRYHVRNR